MGDSLLKRNSSIKKSTDGLVGSPQSPKAAAADTSFGPPSAHSTILISRLRDLKHLVKGLISYVDGCQTLHEHNSKTYSKLASDLSENVVQESQQFLDASQQGGFQKLLLDIKSDTNGVSSAHAVLARNLDSAVLAPLKQLRLEIKANVKSIESEVGKLETDRERWKTGQPPAFARAAGCILHATRSLEQCHCRPAALVERHEVRLRRRAHCSLGTLRGVAQHSSCPLGGAAT